ncbi:hypothetical protein D3C84_842590 [compost metagenome]
MHQLTGKLPGERGAHLPASRHQIHRQASIRFQPLVAHQGTQGRRDGGGVILNASGILRRGGGHLRVLTQWRQTAPLVRADKHRLHMGKGVQLLSRILLGQVRLLDLGFRGRSFIERQDDRGFLLELQRLILPSLPLGLTSEAREASGIEIGGRV